MNGIKKLEIIWEQVKNRVQQEANLCDSLRCSLKDQEEAVSQFLERAEREKEGYHILPGTGGKPFFVGKPPCWHEDRVGDDEYVVLLNRMSHWNDFIAAYASVLYPYTEKQPEISTITFEEEKDKLAFTVNGITYSCSWRGERFMLE